MELIELNATPFPKNQLQMKLEEHDVLINHYAEEYFAHPAFSTDHIEEMLIEIASLQEIGLENGATLSEIIQHLKKTDLKPCPVNTGLFLRFAWRDQPQSSNSILSGEHRSPDQAVTVLSEPIVNDDTFPKGVYLRNVDGRLWLRGYVCDSSYRFSGNDLFAFISLKEETMIDLSAYENKKIKVYLKDGSTFEGFGVHNSIEYSYHEFGIDAECLQICDYIIREDEIERVELIEGPPSIQRTEEDMTMLFSVGRSFSEHLKRWEDNELPDKYDNNFFEYSSQPTREEYESALNFQRERGDRFIKLEGDSPLTDDFGLSSGVTLTMQLSGDSDDWTVNDEIEIKEPGYKEFIEMELKHFGPVYGEDFTARNADHLYEIFDFRGAYIGKKLVGTYYFYSSNGYTCVDGLIVDEDHRHRHVATTLLKHAVSEAAENVVFLHADRDDTPRRIYEKLGFREVSRRYEYLSTDVSRKQAAEDEYEEEDDDFGEDLHSPCLRFQK